MLHDILERQGASIEAPCRLGSLFALIGSEKESNDLCAGAAIVWPEQAITNAICDAASPAHATAFA